MLRKPNEGKKAKAVHKVFTRINRLRWNAQHAAFNTYKKMLAVGKFVVDSNCAAFEFEAFRTAALPNRKQ